MTDRATSGARWLRCDLHVHTPFDRTKSFGEDLQGARQALDAGDEGRFEKLARRFFDACRAADLDLVAITDHNSVEGYERLSKYLPAWSETNGASLTLLPGVELTVGGERKLHVLLVTEQATPVDWLAEYVTAVFDAKPRHNDRGEPLSCQRSLLNFCRYTRDCFEESGYQYILIPAHINRGSGLESELRSASPSTWEDEIRGSLRARAFAQRLWAGFQVRGDPDGVPGLFDLLKTWAAAFFWNTTLDNLDEAVREALESRMHWPILEASDPNCHGDIGSAFTWLKMEIRDVEGIRLALLDPESRLRRMSDGPPIQDYPRLEGIRIQGTDFFESVELSLSPSLTTLIGGRGTGKSTIIEYLRYALDRARREDFSGHGADEVRKNVSSILEAKGERDFGETAGTLLPEHRIELDVVVATRRYRVVRDAEGIEVELDPDDDDAEAVPFLDVRELLQPRILSQRQISRIAHDPASQRSALDALVARAELEGFRRERRSARERIERLQKERARLEALRRELPARETELQKVRDQIEFLEKKGRRDVLVRFEGFERERRWLDATLEEVEAHAGSLEEWAATLNGALERWPQPPESGPSGEWIASVAEEILQRIATTEALLRDEADALREVAAAMAEKRADEWQPEYVAVQKAYGELREEMKEKEVDFDQHEKLLQQRALLEREIAELRSIDDEIASVKADLDRARAELVEIHERRSALRKAQADVLEELDADVRIDVQRFMDREDLEARREEWFAGAGLQGRDWEKLVEYVMVEGEVPRRFAELVEALRADIEATADRARVLGPEDSRVAALVGDELGSELTGYFFNALEERDRIRLDEMERFLPEDRVEARVRGADGEFKPIATGSLGQRSTAVLSLLLSAGNQPLIIDQPEDDLDNRYVYDVVVDLLRRKKFSRQIFIATHNANIPVNGDAELIIALHAKDRLGEVLEAGSIDRDEVKDSVSDIMEGSAEAFRLRRERYGF